MNECKVGWLNELINARMEGWINELMNERKYE